MSDEALSNEVKHDVKTRYEQQNPYSSSDFEGMNDEEHRLVLHHSAQLQREAPEQAMLDIQRHMKGGSYSFLAEHVGDLYWRANHQHGGTQGWMNDVDFKVKKTLNALNSHSFHSDNDHEIEQNGGFKVLSKLGGLYASAHSRLPVYNIPSQLAKSAAMSLGLHRYGATAGYLQELGTHVLHPEDAKYGGMWGSEHPDPKRWESEIEQLHTNWRGLHSRQAGINFLKSIGR
jgi:hypothetical protein